MPSTTLSTSMKSEHVCLFVCLAALGLGCSMQGLCCVTRDFSLRCIESLAVASGLSSSAACRILLPDQGSDPCPCIVRWIPHQSSFNTEIDDAISCLDNVWLNTMDRLICSHPTVAHQASFYLFLATAYPVIAAFYLTHCVLSTKTSFLFQFQNTISYFSP